MWATDDDVCVRTTANIFGNLETAFYRKWIPAVYPINLIDFNTQLHPFNFPLLICFSSLVSCLVPRKKSTNNRHHGRDQEEDASDEA